MTSGGTSPRRVARRVALRFGELLAAVVLAAGVGLAALAAARGLHLVGPSRLPDALRTSVGALAVVLLGLAVTARRLPPVVRWLAAVALPAALVGAHLGLLLADTPHYLFGLGGDQIQRVLYLARFADAGWPDPALTPSGFATDPFYPDAAPFYPPLWFWVGGGLAHLADVPGWRFYQPFAVATMAAAGPAAFVGWRGIVGTRVAAVVGMVVAVVGLETAAYEPYSWILVAMLPVVAAHAWDALSTGLGDLRRLLVAGAATGAFLGIAALTYTLVAAIGALVATLLALAVVLVHRSPLHRPTHQPTPHPLSRIRVRSTDPRPLDHGVAGADGDNARGSGLGRRLGWGEVVVRAAAWLLTAGTTAALVASAFWWRHLSAVLSGTPSEPSVANRFVPPESTELPTPMFAATALAPLCLVGLAWCAWCAGHRLGYAGRIRSPLERAGVGVALCAAAGYGWFVLSGLLAPASTSLLPFRMIPLVTSALAVGGVLAAAQAWRLVAEGAVRAVTPVRTSERQAAVTGRHAVVAVLLGACVLGAQQHVTPENQRFADAARRTASTPPPAAVALAELTGRAELNAPNPDPADSNRAAPTDPTVLTTDSTLLPFVPLHSFQAPTKAYAAPTARYSERAEEIRGFARAHTPAELTAALDRSAFRAPTAFVLLRRPEGFTYSLAVDQMPVQPDNRLETVVFDPAAFADPARFVRRTAGEYEVLVRTSGR